MSPFFYGFLLAYILNIPCGSIGKLVAKSKNRFIVKRQKLLSILITLVILITIIVTSLSLVIPAVKNSISLFIDSIPVYWESVVKFIDYFNNWGLFGLHISEEKIFAKIGDMVGDFSVENIWQPIMGIGTAIIGGFIAFISSIYILFEKDNFKGLIGRLFKIFASDRTSLLVAEVFVRLNRYFRQYIRTQTIDGMIVGVLTTILLFALGSPYALILGVIMVVLNYIPYLGSIAATFIAIVAVVLTQGITRGAIAAASLLIIQLVDANYIQPRLLSDSFKLSPFFIIISITIGGAIGGILGMVVTIPIVAVLKDIFDSVVDYYEHKKFGK